MNDQNNENELHLVVFKLGKEEFSVDINSIREIIKYPQITRVPNTPHYIVGVINLRGQITTVMTLRERFNMSGGEQTDDTRILIVSSGSEYIGLIVDEVTEVLKIDRDHLVITDESVAQTYGNYISGIVKLDNRLIILLDLMKLFARDEI